MTALFTATVLLGASLLLLVQPMIGKRLLPQLGAAPAVWNTCLVFFQFLLLAGYAYAHGAAAWLSPRRRLVLHAALVLLPLAVLRPRASSAPPGRRTRWRLLQALAASVGLLFFVLGERAGHAELVPARPTAGAGPVDLAASNAGPARASPIRAAELPFPAGPGRPVVARLRGVRGARSAVRCGPGRPFPRRSTQTGARAPGSAPPGLRPAEVAR
jgi:hypothetical protein